MITEVSVGNFKGFGELQTAQMAPITLVYGPNSGGKSSLIQSLLLLKQSMEDERLSYSTFNLAPRGRLVDLGSFRSLAHRHLVRGPVEISLTVRGDNHRGFGPGPVVQRVVGENLISKITLRFSGTSSKGSQNKKQDNSSLRETIYSLRNDLKELFKVSFAPAYDGYFKFFDKAQFDTYLTFLREDTDVLQEIERMSRHRVGVRSQSREPLPHDFDVDWLDIKSALEDPTFETQGGLPYELDRVSVQQQRERLGRNVSLRALTAPISDTNFKVRQALANFSYLGPLRSAPERLYLNSGPQVRSVGVYGEETPQLLLQEEENIEKRIDDVFEKFEIPYRIKVDRLGDAVTGDILSVRLRDRRLRVSVGLTDVGFGIGQLLPIIVESMVRKTGVICVEEPEIHLHPRLQANVADLMIETAFRSQEDESRGGQHGYAEPVQWIVETHSETLILRLQRRIREGLLRPENVSVLYVNSGDNGEGVIRRLRLDEDGEFIDEWPDGFFDEAFEEIMGE